MDPLSYLSNADPAAIDELYAQYKRDKNSVDATWQRFFEGFEFQHASFSVLPTGQAATEIPGAADHVGKEFKVLNLIHAYR